MIGLFGYFDINIAAAFLGVTLIGEVVLLLALAFSVLFTGGGPDGLVPEAVNPLNAFKSLDEGGGMGLAIDGTTIAAGSAAIGLFFAFWSWVGFETTAVYGEESRNPKHIVPRATLIAVVGLGTFYTFVSWMMIAGNGKATAIEKANTDSIGLWVDLAEDKLGGAFVGDIYLFLIVIGSFACGLAFHTAASRYLYAIGRELPATKNTLGAHPRHAPHAARRVGGAEHDHPAAHARLLLAHHRTATTRSPARTSTSTACWRSSARWRSSSCRRSPVSR